MSVAKVYPIDRIGGSRESPDCARLRSPNQSPRKPERRGAPVSVPVPATETSTSRPDGPRPQPGLLRTIGVLDILFGAVLLLGGLVCLKTTAPVVVEGTPLEIEPAIAQAFF